MTFLLIFLLLIFILSLPTVRAWLVIKFFGFVQRRIQRQMQERMRTQGNARQHTSRDTSTQEQRQRRDKVDIEQVEARKFDRDDTGEYIDFEELPK